MRFIRDIIARKTQKSEPPATEEPLSGVDVAEPAEDISLDKLLEQMDSEAESQKETDNEVVENPDGASETGDARENVNIWDIDDDTVGEAEPDVAKSEVEAPALAPAAPTHSKNRPGRVKTRILGFEHSNGVVDLFDPEAVVESAWQPKFPVGWVVIVDGPGKGEAFTLLTGLSQIGRGADQTIQLDYGDGSISRNNHAAIAYDAAQREFLFGHGGKSNIVRLNDVPVLSTEPLKNGDVISIGETKLRFMAFCGKHFDWDDEDSEDTEEDASDTAIS